MRGLLFTAETQRRGEKRREVGKKLSGWASSVGFAAQREQRQCALPGREQRALRDAPLIEG